MPLVVENVATHYLQSSQTTRVVLRMVLGVILNGPRGATVAVLGLEHELQTVQLRVVEVVRLLRTRRRCGRRVVPRTALGLSWNGPSGVGPVGL